MTTPSTGRREGDFRRCLDETLDGDLHGSSLGNFNVFADGPGAIKLAKAVYQKGCDA